MSGNDHAAEDRTEAPTQKRLEQAREQGQLSVSRDLTMLASLGGGALGAVTMVPALARQIAEQSGALLGLLDRVRLTDGTILNGQISGILASAAMIVAAVALPGAICCIACTVVQTQFYIGGAPIRFQISRISPQGSLMLYTTGHCKPAPDRLTSHCATVHSQHFQLD